MYRTSGLIFAGVFIALASRSSRTPITVSMLSAETTTPVASLVAAQTCGIVHNKRPHNIIGRSRSHR